MTTSNQKSSFVRPATCARRGVATGDGVVEDALITGTLERTTWPTARLYVSSLCPIPPGAVRAPVCRRALSDDPVGHLTGGKPVMEPGCCRAFAGTRDEPVEGHRQCRSDRAHRRSPGVAWSGLGAG